MQTKKCVGCESELPLSMFHGPYRRENGSEWYMSRCRPCVRDQKNAVYAARKAGSMDVSPIEHQECRDCGVVKPAAEFGVDMAKPTGIKIYCKPCANLRWRASRYGLTRVQVEELFQKSNHSCAVCSSKVRLVIDHDHSMSGPEAVRGILCDDCNVALGRLSDDPDRIRRLAQYVERE